MPRARDMELGVADKSYYYWRGGLGVLFGAIVLAWPNLTKSSLLTWISLWLLLIGVISVVSGVTSLRRDNWGWVGATALGVLELGVAAYFFQRPNVTDLTIVSLLGIVFAVQGLIYLGTTFMERGVSVNRKTVAVLYAVISIAAAIWIWRYPLHGTLSFVWLLGLYAAASGGMLLALGSEVRE